MKCDVRKRMREILSAMPPEAVARKSRLACQAVAALEEFRSAEAIMTYLPIAGELNATAIALAAWRLAKTVLVPKVNWRRRCMLAVEIDSLDDGLLAGRHGIPEPVRDAPWPADRIDLVIVPALAYDRTGARLGRGGGFYDRFLAQAELRAVACGLAFDEQVLAELPLQPHDRRVHMLVTDTEVLRFDG